MSLKTRNEKRMLTDLRLWARWRKSDRHYQLGYPSQSAEQNIATTGNKALPSWESEMQIDGLVEHEMPKSDRRVVVAAYNIPQREHGITRNNIIKKRMYFIKKDGVYRFPTDADSTARCLGISRPTFYNILNCAKAWLLGKAY